MSLKDKWKDLQDAIEGVMGSGDDISAEHLNLIANELIKSQIDIENNKKYKANKTDIPTKVSQLLNDLSFTTESKVKEMIEELPPLLSGADIDTKYTVDEFNPPLMMYVSDILNDDGSATGEHYANAPFIGYGMIVSRSYDDDGVKNLWQMALSSEGVLKTRIAYEEQNLKDVLWERDLIPKKVGDLENDKEYTTKKDVEDVIKETKAEANEIYANALKGFASGTEIHIDDVSPVVHNVKITTNATSVNVKGANLFDVYSSNNISSNGTCGVEVIGNGNIKTVIIKKGSPQYATSTIAIPLSKAGTLYFKTKIKCSNAELTKPEFHIRLRNSSSGANTTKKTLTDISTEWNEFTYNISVSSSELEKYDEIMLLIYVKNSSVDVYNVGEYVELKDIMLSVTDTEYVPYSNNTYEVVDGAVGIKSLYPTMYISSDVTDAVINVEYNKDINKAFEQMQQAIISLGGII